MALTYQQFALTTMYCTPGAVDTTGTADLQWPSSMYNSPGLWHRLVEAKLGQLGATNSLFLPLVVEVGHTTLLILL